jgi:hypothetical protein
MKSTAMSELAGFHEFVSEKLNNGGSDLSPEEALDQWRALHADPDELSESVAAVRLALADMAAGDSGRSVDDVLADLRSRHGLTRP